VLTSVFAFAVAYEIVGSIVHVMQQLEMIPVMAEYMPRIMDASAPGQGGAGGAEVGQAIAMVSIVLGIAMFAGMAIVKPIFYIVGFVHLRKSRVVQLFQESVQGDHP